MVRWFKQLKTKTVDLSESFFENLNLVEGFWTEGTEVVKLLNSMPKISLLMIRVWKSDQFSFEYSTALLNSGFSQPFLYDTRQYRIRQYCLVKN